MTGPVGETVDRGAALLLTLLVTLLLVALSGGLAIVCNTEGLLSYNFLAGTQVMYAAEAGVERALSDVGAIEDWTSVVSGAVHTVPFESGAVATAPWSGTVDLAATTARLQALSDANLAVGANNPRWHLFLSGSLDDVVGGARAGTVSAYVLVWAADDPAEGDGDPSVDSNGVLVLRAQAVTSLGLARNVQVSLVRERGVTKILSWREG